MAVVENRYHCQYSRRLLTLGVVRLSISIQFRVPFQKSNEQNDLNLGRERKSIPLFRRGQIRGWVWHTAGGQGPRENKVRLDAISDKGGHGDTTVLDFGMAQPSNGASLVESPISRINQIKGIPVLHNRVKLAGNILQVRLFCKRVKGAVSEDNAQQFLSNVSTNDSGKKLTLLSARRVEADPEELVVKAAAEVARERAAMYFMVKLLHGRRKREIVNRWPSFEEMKDFRRGRQRFFSTRLVGR